MLSLLERDCAWTDAELVALARRGDKDAFGQLIQRHYPACLNLASFILRDWAEAKDEVQNACRKAFEHFDQYKPEAEFVTWMLRIVVNQCLMLIRVRKRARFLYLDGDSGHNVGRTLELPALAIDPEHEVIKQEMHEILHKEIRSMPLLFKTIILLSDVEGLPMIEVAGRLGITVSAAKSRLLRARNELRQRVISHCGGNAPIADISTRRLPAKPVRCMAAVA